MKTIKDNIDLVLWIFIPFVLIASWILPFFLEMPIYLVVIAWIFRGISLLPFALILFLFIRVEIRKKEINLGLGCK